MQAAQQANAAPIPSAWPKLIAPTKLQPRKIAGVATNPQIELARVRSRRMPSKQSIASSSHAQTGVWLITIRM